MRKRLIGGAVLALTAAACLVASAVADNYQFRDGQGQLGFLASKTLNGVQYPIHLLYGLFSGATPTPVAVDASGNVGVNVQSSALPTGAATAANQNATQAAPGTSSSNATGVQGVLGGLPVFTSPSALSGTLVASSGNVANASAVATLAGVTGKTTYLTGFTCTASGATAASIQNLTVAGLAGGTLTYTFAFPAGVTTAASPLSVSFPTPMQTSALNTAIVVTLPAGGSGNTNAACSAAGFQQ